MIKHDYDYDNDILYIFNEGHKIKESVEVSDNVVVDLDKLSPLLKLKYREITDAIQLLGGIKKIRETFINFQKHLYSMHKLTKKK